MSEFTRGVLFTVSMYVFGRSVFELGRLYEQERTLKVFDDITKDLEKSIEETNEKLKEAGAL